jgi:hypothetical protein
MVDMNYQQKFDQRPFFFRHASVCLWRARAYAPPESCSSSNQPRGHCSGICNTHKMERRLEVPYLIPGEATLRINTFHRLLSRGIISCTVESRGQQSWLDVQMRSVGALTSGPLKSLFHLSTIFVPVCFLLKAFDERNAMMTKEWETGTRWWNSSGWFSWHRHIAQSPSLKFGKYKTFCDWKHFYPLRVHLQVVSLLPCTQSK